MKPIKVNNVKIYLVWFDSLGAKSSCTLIETPDISILVDPGVAEMQPNYPLPLEDKIRYRNEAFKAIVEAASRAEVITISHYHYDHHTLPTESFKLYEGKTLLIKDPNTWINESQWNRARLFLSQLWELSTGSSVKDILVDPGEVSAVDPLKNLPLASSKDLGDYQKRREELFATGRVWFNKMVKMWSEERWVREFKSDKVSIRFADSKFFKFNSTIVKFTQPMFHGIEYDRLGWVTSLTVEYGGAKVIHTSDLQGPMIEDYAYWIIKEDPEVLIMDGPPTYLYGYTVNRTNLERAIENVCWIVESVNTKIIVYDHHLLRDKLYMKRLSKLYANPKAKGRVLTAAEWLGLEPLILKLSR